MASLVVDAIEITSNDGNGKPIAYTNSSLGISSGILRAATGQFDFDGGLTITGPYASFPQTWAPRVLSENFKPTITREVNFKRAGGIGSVSTLQIQFQNTALLFDTLEDNGFYLSRCRVRYYRGTSTDGTNWTFEQRWEGMIEEHPFNETVLTARCVDISKDIFKSLPSRSADSTTFPEASKEALDKPIPIVLGRVAYSPLLHAVSAGSKVTTTIIDGVEYKVCGIKDRSIPNRTVNLHTPGMSFQTNDALLVNSFLTVIAGGADQSRRIMSNVATDGSGMTQVVIQEAMDETSPAFVGWSASQTSKSVWYGEITRFTAVLLASSKTIYEMIQGPAGLPGLYTYDEDAKLYTDISEIRVSTSLSNIKSTGFPGYNLISKANAINGDVAVYSPIYPLQVILRSTSNVTPSGPAVLQPQPNLNDRNQAIGYNFTTTTTPAFFTLDVDFGLDEQIKTFDDIYLLLDFSISRVTIDASARLQVTVTSFDLYGRETEAVIPLYTLVPFTTMTATPLDVFTLPSSYYGLETADPADFTLQKAALSLLTLLDNLKKTLAYNRIRILFTITTPDANIVVNMREIGFVGKRNVNFTNQASYGTLKGETFGSTWQARKTSANPVLILPDALEHLIRNYDYNYPAWQAAKAYIVGNKVRSIADNGHFYICTVAGTSHATTEPTFPTTSGGTVADNTVTWQELGTFKIETASFDTLATQRANWFIGHTLAERKDSVEWYRQISAQGMLIILQDAQGQVKVKSWLDNTTSLVAFSSGAGGNIIEGTCSGEMELSDMADVSNCGTLRYDWSPGSKSFNKQLVIDHIDEAAFPAEDEPVDPGTSLGSFSIELINLGFFGYYFGVATSGAHGLTTGDIVGLTGNTHGYDFDPRSVSVLSSTVFTVRGHFTATSPSTTGTLKRHTQFTAKWKTFAGGFEGYANGKNVWEKFRASYLLTKVIQKFPDDLADCHFFIDPKATDPSGNFIWSDLSAVGDEHSAVFLLRFMSEWTAWQKKITPPFETEDSAALSAREEGDRCTFQEPKLTNNVALPGWVMEKTYLPGGRIRWRVILRPEQLAECNTLTDTQGASDTTTDTQGAADTLTDTEC